MDSTQVRADFEADFLRRTFEADVAPLRPIFWAWGKRQQPSSTQASESWCECAAPTWILEIHIAASHARATGAVSWRSAQAGPGTRTDSEDRECTAVLVNLLLLVMSAHTPRWVIRVSDIYISISFAHIVSKIIGESDLRGEAGRGTCGFYPVHHSPSILQNNFIYRVNKGHSLKATELSHTTG